MNQRNQPGVEIVRFSVPGKPVPYTRMVRGSSRTRRQASRYSAYKDAVGYTAKAAMRGSDPVDCRLSVEVTHYAPEPGRADLDNVVKGLLDSMNKIVYTDDKSVCELLARWEPVPDQRYERVEVVVSRFDEKRRLFGRLRVAPNGRMEDDMPNAFEPDVTPSKPCSLCGDTGRVEVREELAEGSIEMMRWRWYGGSEATRPYAVSVYECWKCHPQPGIPTVLEPRHVVRWY